jgi:hypothetical protein
MAAAPSKKVTVPLGVPDPLLTVAVNVIDCPNDAGLRDDCTTVLVGTPFTVCVSTGEVLGSKVASPW